MFGLLYMLGSGLAYAISGVKASYDNAQCRERGIHRDKQKYISDHTYIDRRGATRDIVTNEHRIQTWDKYHDVWLEDFHGNKLRNLTQEKRMVEAAQKAAAAPPGTIAVRYDWWTYQNTKIRNGNDYVSGTVYIGIKTGDLYFKRRFWLNSKMELVNVEGKRCWPSDVICYEYYMKISDGLLVCPTEEMVKRKNPPSKEITIDFMNFFNEEQKKGGYKKRKDEREDSFMREYNLKYNRLSDYYMSDYS